MLPTLAEAHTALVRRGTLMGAGSTRKRSNHYRMTFGGADPDFRKTIRTTDAIERRFREAMRSRGEERGVRRGDTPLKTLLLLVYDIWTVSEACRPGGDLIDANDPYSCGVYFRLGSLTIALSCSCYPRPMPSAAQAAWEQR